MKLLSCNILKDGEIRSAPVVSNEEISSGAERINIFPVEKQSIIGFGGAFTESSAYLYSLMSKDNKLKALELLFGDSGLKYRLCRVCIGSCDFSTEAYTYVADGDSSLESFDISRDKKYVIPFIKDAMEYIKGDFTLIASPWSPPAFMKDNDSLFEGGCLKEEFYSIYADYIVKFILAYWEEGIKISLITPQNEPNASQTWESCIFSAKQEARFIRVLSDKLKKSAPWVKILCWDHNKGRLYDRAKAIYEAVGDNVCGCGFHWYSGSHFDELRMHRELYPQKMIIETEFCNGLTRKFFDTYRNEILNNLNCGVSGICEWNMILDKNGAPFHNRGFGCGAPICYDTEKKVLTTRNMYNDMFMFSHFIGYDAKSLFTSTFDEKIRVCAAKRTDGIIVAVIENHHTLAKEFTLCCSETTWRLDIPANSLMTVEISDQ
ncbi:MAG: glucosylceramidase [Clostridia bacterium]|nr:glucosylceramidase [Clostridia bacterium]